jgi:hypothetical protein
MIPGPQFEVLEAVVCAISVAVMDVLGLKEWPT